MAASSTVRERRNWWIHLLYVRQEYDECLRVVEEVLRACNGLAEYPLYIKGERRIVADEAVAFDALQAREPYTACSRQSYPQASFEDSKDTSRSPSHCFRLRPASIR